MKFSRFFFFPLLIVFLTQAANISAAEISPAAEQDFERGQVAAEQGAWDTALRYFKRAQQLAPRAPQFLYVLGVAHQKRKHSILSMVFYKAYLEAVPKASNRKQVEKQILKEEIYLESLVDELFRNAWEASKKIPAKASQEQKKLLKLKGEEWKINDINTKRSETQKAILNLMFLAGQLDLVKTFGLRHPEWWIYRNFLEEIVEMYKSRGNLGIANFYDAISLIRELSFATIDYYTKIYYPGVFSPCRDNDAECEDKLERSKLAAREDWDATKKWRVSLYRGLSLISLSNVYWKFGKNSSGSEIFKEGRDLFEESLAKLDVGMDLSAMTYSDYRIREPFFDKFWPQDKITEIWFGGKSPILIQNKRTKEIIYNTPWVKFINDCDKLIANGGISLECASEEFVPPVQVDGGKWLDIVTSGKSPGKTKFLLDNPTHTDLLGQIEMIQRKPAEEKPVALATLAFELARSAYFVKHNQ